MEINHVDGCYDKLLVKSEKHSKAAFQHIIVKLDSKDVKWRTFLLTKVNTSYLSDDNSKLHIERYKVTRYLLLTTLSLQHLDLCDDLDKSFKTMFKFYLIRNLN